MLLSKKKFKVISLFTGAGGLDLGFEAAGFSMAVAVEFDPLARKTIKRNRPRWKLLAEGDIHKISPKALRLASGFRRREADVILGGPPCQPFSKSAYWATGSTKRLKDERADTLNAMLSAVEEVLPKVVVIENVRGISYSKKDEGLKLLRSRFRAINKRCATSYAPVVVCLNAVDYGVAQYRERIFIIAFRDGQKFIAPHKTHGTDRRRFATAWDAIGTSIKSRDQQLQPSGKWAGLISSIPEGQNYLHHTARGAGLPLFGWRTRYWSFLLKLAKDQPSWTIQASPGPATGPFHWDNRLLSVGEMCSLQSFPKDWIIEGDYLAARRQVGNAVPPALAEAVARSIAASLEGRTCSTRDLKFSTKLKRLPPPKANRVGPVKAQYLKLDKRFDEHPGTGKGPRGLLIKRKPKSNSVRKLNIRTNRRGHNANRKIINGRRQNRSAA